jgi:erythromycin esterase
MKIAGILLQPVALLLLLTALAACDSTLEPPTTPDDETDEADPPPSFDITWLSENAISFNTAEPGTDYADLIPLKDIVGDARIVALGEGTHGTREFFQMKHRVLEFLVREMGFNAFAIEATWAESNDVNQYVHTGEGDPAVLLSNLYFWTWNTEEVLDMIHWMRQHNQANPGQPVSFQGFDMQFSRRAMDMVSSFVWRVDQDNHHIVGLGYFCWRVWAHALSYPSMGDSIQTDCRTGVEAAYALVADNREAYEQATSPEEYATVLRAARITVQHEYTRSRRWVETEPHPRDRFMAENVEWLLDQGGPDRKIVLWAHNAHVMDLLPWMGGYLRQRYGDDMVIAGFSFHQGQFNAYGWKDGRIVSPLGVHSSSQAMAGSYEYYFNQVEPDRFFVDLRPLRLGAPDHAAWLKGPLPLRMIGAVTDVANDARNYMNTRLVDQFDFLIHFRRTEPSRLLPFVSD